MRSNASGEQGGRPPDRLDNEGVEVLYYAGCLLMVIDM